MNSKQSRDLELQRNQNHNARLLTSMKGKGIGCYFCKAKDILVAVIRLTETDNSTTIHPICHTCYNQATYCKDGLKYKGETVRL